MGKGNTIKIINHFQYWTPERVKIIKVYFDEKLYLLEYNQELIFEITAGEEKRLVIKKWFQKFDIKFQASETIEIIISSNPFTGTLQVSSNNSGIQIFRNRLQAFGNFLIIGGPVLIVLVVAFLISIFG